MAQGLHVPAYHAPCPKTVTEVEFDVENDNDIWEITVTNTSSSSAQITNKLTKE